MTHAFEAKPPSNNHIKLLIAIYLLALITLFLLQACVAAPPAPESAGEPAAAATPSPTPEATASPSPAATPAPSAVKLSWEAYPENRPWTSFVTTLVSTELLTGFEKAKDKTRFCPKYASLDHEHRVWFWAELVSAVSYYESGWSAVSRMIEKDLGIDPATGMQVASEGLLQLSYQDVKNYPMIPECGEIDWRADKPLAAKDPKKTILNPFINLGCGVRIMAHLVSGGSAITTPSNRGAASAYWSVLREGHKVDSIAKLTKQVPGCL